MNKGWIVWIALLVVVAIVTYVYTGFNLNFRGTTTTLSTTTVTEVTTSLASTSLSTIPPTVSENCASVYIAGANPYASSNVTCIWSGGKLGIWVMAGKAFNPTLAIVGHDGITYLQGTFNYNATTFFSNVTLPAQNYTVTLYTTSENSSGGAPFVKFNLTTSPPAMTYSYIFNPNFSNGQYTGWNVSGSGFGTAPFSITAANSNTLTCYQGAPWRNYVGEYFATTFNCGISVAPGNLTSEAFRVNPKTPFLNFRIISPQDSLIYIEILKANGSVFTPAVVAHFNTYNISLGANVSSTFANVSVPLTTLSNRVVKIRIVASTLQPQRFVAVGDFALGNLPHTDKWVSAQMNITR